MMAVPPPSKVKVPDNYFTTHIVDKAGQISTVWHKVLDDTLARTIKTLGTDGTVHLTGRTQFATSLSGSADPLPVFAGFYTVNSAGVNAMTLPTPTAAQEGNIIEVWSNTANAHTITAASACIASGGALKTKITFPAGVGAGVALKASNGNWHIIRQGFTPVTLT